MKRRIIALIAAAVTLFSVLAMTSCFSLAGDLMGIDRNEGTSDYDYITRSELDAILAEYNKADDGGKYITEEQLSKILAQIKGNGDNFDIDITTGESVNAVAAAKSVLSVVSVYSAFTIQNPYRPGTTQSGSSAGSGVIYQLDKANGDAYIITNYHVVYNENATTAGGISEDITLLLYGQEYSDYKIPATYVGGSMNYDLAVLKVDNSWVLKNSNAMAANIADSNNISLLETAIAIGNPEALGISATVGYISVDSEYINISMTTLEGLANSIQLRVMRVDAAVNSGNSGGGLFNDKGELIGIVNAKIADTSVENIGYAIPSNIAKAIADNIIYYSDKSADRCVHRCLLGIEITQSNLHTVYDTETGKIYKKEDAIISKVNAGSFAYGSLLVDDIIKKVTIDGTEYEIDRMFEVIDCMLNARVGSTVKFDIIRGGAATSKTFVIDQSTLTAVE